MSEHALKLAREIVEGVLDALPHLGGRIVKRASGYALEFRGPIVSRTSGAEREPMEVMIGYVQTKLAAAPDLLDAAEMLWSVVANVSGGDWTKQSAEWQEAATRWRDRYFAALAKARPINAPAPGESDEAAP